jgi:alpha-ketoglutarate-dependent taurine dioxygenase
MLFLPVALRLLPDILMQYMENTLQRTTFLYILTKQETSGETLFANQVEAYTRLSPGSESDFMGLKALHSGIE